MLQYRKALPSYAFGRLVRKLTWRHTGVGPAERSRVARCTTMRRLRRGRSMTCEATLEARRLRVAWTACRRIAGLGLATAVPPVLGQRSRGTAAAKPPLPVGGSWRERNWAHRRHDHQIISIENCTFHDGY
ncbi:MAG: hypothetical protein ACLUE8_10635 [Lachnospiraceae bacterium]